MKRNGFSHIRKWLLIFLAMVLLTTMALYVVIYVEVSGLISSMDHGRGTGSAVSSGQTATTASTGAQLRLLMLLTGGFIICALSGSVWMILALRRLRRPVRDISKAISKLTKGQLNETVIIDTSDEFEQIGKNINELAVNLQELLLHIWKQTGQCLILLENIQSNPDFRHDKQLTLESLGYLKQLNEAINNLREMAKAYVFYDVTIQGTETTAVNNPGDVLHSIRLDKPPKDCN
jgi:methyl-accepting chemotaxis protein